MINLFKSKKNKNETPELEPQDVFGGDKGKILDEKGNPVLKKNKTKNGEIVGENDFEVAESSEFELGQKIEKKEVLKKERAKKVDVERYKDLEGISMKKLTTGLWLVEHRAFIISLFYGFLVLVGAITWGYFLFSFGGYLIFGMRNDDKNIEQIVTGSQIPHEIFVEQSPKLMKFGDVRMIKTEEGKYDFMIEVTNVNSQHWANFDYYFVASGKEIGHSGGFILPNEKKYVFLLGQNLTQAPAGVEFKIDNVKWSRLNKIEYPNWEKFYTDHTRITVSDTEFIPESLSELSEKVDLNLLRFKLHNDTAYSYWEVDLGVRLLNRNTIIGAEKIVVKNLIAGEVRDFEITWPGKLSKVSEIIIVPEVNIVDESVYIKPGS